MRRIPSVIGVVLVVSLAFASQAFCGPIPYGTATVDGNLSDWSGVTWNAFDTVYDGSPTDIAEGGWAARWTPTKVYMAVKVRDTAHVFTNSYTDWSSRDAVEMYIHTTGVGTDADYMVYQEPAQEWAVGMKTAANGSVWTSVGYSPGYYAPATAGVDYAATENEFVAKGSIDGQWLYYEAAMAPLQYFGGLRGAADIVSPLSAGMTIGVDCTVVGNDGVHSTWDVPGYTGMKYSSFGQPGIADWSYQYGHFSQHTLTSTPEPGTLVLLASAGLGLLAYAWRKRRQF